METNESLHTDYTLSNVVTIPLNVYTFLRQITEISVILPL